jgi:hypothetical protein
LCRILKHINSEHDQIWHLCSFVKAIIKCQGLCRSVSNTIQVSIICPVQSSAHIKIVIRRKVYLRGKSDANDHPLLKILWYELKVIFSHNIGTILRRIDPCLSWAYGSICCITGLHYSVRDYFGEIFEKSFFVLLIIGLYHNDSFFLKRYQPSYFDSLFCNID